MAGMKALNLFILWKIAALELKKENQTAKSLATNMPKCQHTLFLLNSNFCLQSSGFPLEFLSPACLSIKSWQEPKEKKNNVMNLCIRKEKTSSKC